ncbi:MULTISPECIES: ABC transporter permease [Streptacidiphilus]|uniref:ABC transporter permease n=2 Tax=Streptacidiphilus TaxID=228398 RepID=A0ABV6UGD0_9ACTN|nr:ABC transporter permease [Streptacidiphilus jeojiense]
MFFTYLRRELRRRRKAALVISMGLALGIGLVLTVTSVSAGMKNAQSTVLHSLYGLGTDITVTKSAAAGAGGGAQKFGIQQSGSGSKSSSADRLSVNQGTATMASSTVTQVASQSNVEAAVGSLLLNDFKFDGSFKLKSGTSSTSTGTGQGGGQQGGEGGGQGGTPPSGAANFSLNTLTIMGTDTSNITVGPLSSLKITSGVNFTSAQSNSLVAVVDSSYATQKKLKVGSTVTISGKAFKVIGIATASSGTSAANVYIPLTQAQTLADMKNKVTTVYVKASSSQQISAVKTAITKNVSGTTVTTASDLASTVSGSLSTAANLVTSMGKWLSLAVLAAAFLISSLLTSSAVNRRVREFGTLKALGWRSKRVIGQVMGEALVNGLIGGVLGIALGLAGAAAITAFSPTLSASTASSTASQGGPGGGGGPGQAASAAAKAIEVHLTAPVTLSAIAVAVALAVAGGLVAGGFGGWRASRLRPADALRRVE